jgi:hypothetical protein
MARLLTHPVTFCLTEAQYQELEDYVGQKKRWKSVNDLARDATWQFKAKNKLTAAQERRAAELRGK